MTSPRLSVKQALRIYPATNEIFHDRALLEEEQARLFAGGWILVGLVDQLPYNESRFVYEAEGRSLLITRDGEGRARAFINACTHRGTRLCDREGSGRIQCPYHGWVFGCDGRLLGATKRSGLPPFDERDYGLRPLAIDQVGKFLFVHGDAQPQVGLREFLGPIAANLESLSAEMQTFLFEARVSIDGNWKLAVSGGLEDYHAAFVHKDASERSKISENTTTLVEGGHSWFRIEVPLPPRLRRLFRLLLGVEPEPVLESHSVFPNITIVKVWSFVKLSNWIPIAPDRTLRLVHMFAAVRVRPWLVRPLAWLARKLQGKIMDEDRRIVGEAHLGTRAGATMLRGPAHRMEERVEHLLGEVARRLDCRYREVESAPLGRDDEQEQQPAGR